MWHHMRWLAKATVRQDLQTRVSVQGACMGSKEFQTSSAKLRGWSAMELKNISHKISTGRRWIESLPMYGSLEDQLLVSSDGSFALNMAWLFFWMGEKWATIRREVDCGPRRLVDYSAEEGRDLKITRP